MKKAVFFYIRKAVIIVLLVAFWGSSVQRPVFAQEEIILPKPGVMIHLSPGFNPPLLKGITVHLDNPFKFDFILDRGQAGLSDDSLKEESSKLVKYFLSSITTPEKDLWVNLSPYENNRIIPLSFGQTGMGRDLLAEDYILKQITASLIYPEEAIGKQFWRRVYQEAARKYGTTNIPINTFNKIWIIPGHAKVYEHGNSAFIVNARLKVMLEQDYLSLEKHENVLAGHARPLQTNDGNALGSEIVREIVIPQLEKEVNEGKNFAPLRQVYYSLILAVWFKKRMKDSILGQQYMDQNKVTGIDIDDKNAKQKIYQEYLKAFKKGVYDYIKEEPDPVTREMIPRKYFSGGVAGAFGIGAYVPEQVISPSEMNSLNINAAQVTVNLAIAHLKGFASKVLKGGAIKVLKMIDPRKKKDIIELQDIKEVPVEDLLALREFIQPIQANKIPFQFLINDIEYLVRIFSFNTPSLKLLETRISIEIEIKKLRLSQISFEEIVRIIDAELNRRQVEIPQMQPEHSLMIRPPALKEIKSEDKEFVKHLLNETKKNGLLKDQRSFLEELALKDPRLSFDFRCFLGLGPGMSGDLMFLVWENINDALFNYDFHIYKRDADGKSVYKLGRIYRKQLFRMFDQGKEVFHDVVNSVEGDNNIKEGIVDSYYLHDENSGKIIINEDMPNFFNYFKMDMIFGKTKSGLMIYFENAFKKIKSWRVLINRIKNIRTNVKYAQYMLPVLKDLYFLDFKENLSEGEMALLSRFAQACLKQGHFLSDEEFKTNMKADDRIEDFKKLLRKIDHIYFKGIEIHEFAHAFDHHRGLFKKFTEKRFTEASAIAMELQFSPVSRDTLASTLLYGFYEKDPEDPQGRRIFLEYYAKKHGIPMEDISIERLALILKDIGKSKESIRDFFAGFMADRELWGEFAIQPGQLKITRENIPMEVSKAMTFQGDFTIEGDGLSAKHFLETVSEGNPIKRQVTLVDPEGKRYQIEAQYTVNQYSHLLEIKFNQKTFIEVEYSDQRNNPNLKPVDWSADILEVDLEKVSLEGKGIYKAISRRIFKGIPFIISQPRNHEYLAGLESQPQPDVTDRTPHSILRNTRLGRTRPQGYLLLEDKGFLLSYNFSLFGSQGNELSEAFEGAEQAERAWNQEPKRYAIKEEEKISARRLYPDRNSLEALKNKFQDIQTAVLSKGEVFKKSELLAAIDLQMQRLQKLIEFASPAMDTKLNNDPGGIDLTANRMNLEIDKDNAQISQVFNFKTFKNIEINGLYIKNIELRPLNNLRQVLEVSNHNT